MKKSPPRRSFALDPDRERRLQALARGRGVTVSEILREAVDQILRKADEESFDVRAFRKKWRLDEEGFETGYFEGLRDRSPGRDVDL